MSKCWAGPNFNFFFIVNVIFVQFLEEQLDTLHKSMTSEVHFLETHLSGIGTCSWMETKDEKLEVKTSLFMMLLVASDMRTYGNHR